MKLPDYNLLVRTPVHQLSAKTGTPSPIPGGNITELVKDSWQRNKIWLLGDDVGQFSITGDKDGLARIYDNWLSHDVVELTPHGIVTWNGYIAKMTFHHGVMPRSYDMSDMRNWVKATIGDGIGTYTAAAENTYSQARYGEWHEYLLPGVDTSAEAVAERDAFLKAHAWPSEKPTGGDASRMKEYAQLDVTVLGYGHSLNSYYADDVTITPANGIATAINVTITGSQYINVRSLAANATVLFDDVELIKAGDLVKKLLHVTDGSGNMFRGWIDGSRNFYYAAIDNTPNYVIQGGKVYRSAGDSVEVSPRLLQPGIYRDLDFPISGQHRDSWFADRRDIWVDGVFIDKEGRPKWQPEDTSTSDYQTLYWSQV